jgi:hypothetical protein
VGEDCQRLKQESAGALFKTCKGSSYRAVNYHRPSNSNSSTKSCWSLTEVEECSTFCETEQKSWNDEDGNNWSIAPTGSQPYGTSGERMAHFPAPKNKTDSWHGFPFSRRGAKAFRRRPPDRLLSEWRETNRISFTDYNRAAQGRL